MRQEKINFYRDFAERAERAIVADLQKEYSDIHYPLGVRVVSFFEGPHVRLSIHTSWTGEWSYRFEKPWVGEQAKLFYTSKEHDDPQDEKIRLLIQTTLTGLIRNNIKEIVELEVMEMLHG